MMYTIYHPYDGSMNHDCKPGVNMYKKVYSLEADSLEAAFKLSQNNFNEEYAVLSNRSTSVGDIIQSQEDWENQRCHLVKGTGFQDVPNTWLTYIDWGYIDDLYNESQLNAFESENC